MDTSALLIGSSKLSMARNLHSPEDTDKMGKRAAGNCLDWSPEEADRRGDDIPLPRNEKGKTADSPILNKES